MPPTEESPGRTLLLALSAMCVVAVVVGLVVGGVLLAAANVTGVEARAGTARSSDQDTLYIPKYKPTKSIATLPPITPGKPSPTPTIELPSGSPSMLTPSGAIQLTVTPAHVAPGERINFDGTYPSGDGHRVQIQRRLGATWTDFPVSADVSDGAFHTWIITGQTGRMHFRVYDTDADAASNPVAVVVG